MLVVWLGCELAAWAGYSRSPLSLAWVNLLSSPFYGPAVAGFCFLHLLCRPSRHEIAATLALGVVLSVGPALLWSWLEWTVPLVNTAALGFGCSSLLALAWRARVSRGAARARTLALLLPVCLVQVFLILTVYFLLLSIEICPTTLDGFVYAADGCLGVQPSFLIGRLFAAVPPLAAISRLVYNTLPLAFLVVFTLQSRYAGKSEIRSTKSETNPKSEIRNREGLFQISDFGFRASDFPAQRERGGPDIFPVFLCVGLVGFGLYLLFPVAGPVYVFGPAFPNAPPSVASVLAHPPAAPGVPRNCMPSLHTAWALLIWWHARALDGRVRLLAGLYLALTLLATLGFGFHYGFDLVVAVPFVTTLQAALTPACPETTSVRRRVVLCGVVLTALWLLTLRYGLPLLSLSPLLTAAAALLTVLLPLRGEHLLHRAAEQKEEGGRIKDEEEAA